MHTPGRHPFAAQDVGTPRDHEVVAQLRIESV